MHNKTCVSTNNSIQGLRAIGLLSVFVWHSHWYVDHFFKITLTSYFRGDFANVMFFFLAGFFIGVKYCVKDINTFHFVKGRLRKVYAIYSAMVIICAGYIVYDTIIEKVVLNWNELFKQITTHLLVIQSWLPPSLYPYETALNGPGWFLSTLFFFWIITKAILFIVEKSSKNKIYFAISYMTAVFIYMLSAWIFQKYALRNIVPEIFRPINIMPYVIGMLVGKNSEKLKDERASYSVCEWGGVTVWCDILLLLAFIGCLWLRKKVTYEFIIYGALIVFLTVLVLYIYQNKKSMLCRFLSYSPLVELGNISLEFYLLHMPIIELLLRIKPYCESYIGNAEIVLLAFFITWGIAAVISNLKRGYKENHNQILRHGH